MSKIRKVIRNIFVHSLSCNLDLDNVVEPSIIPPPSNPSYVPVAEIVGNSGGLHHDGVASAPILEYMSNCVNSRPVNITQNHDISHPNAVDIGGNLMMDHRNYRVPASQPIIIPPRRTRHTTNAWSTPPSSPQSPRYSAHRPPRYPEPFIQPVAPRMHSIRMV